jgi:3-polyprenyl-4-hydroxybenzoate decarboxylase
MQEFLWTMFTRFEPAADIHGAEQSVSRYHVGLKAPIVFDCRMKPWYTDVLEVDPETRHKVDARLHELLPQRWR